MKPRNSLVHWIQGFVTKWNFAVNPGNRENIRMSVPRNVFTAIHAIWQQKLLTSLNATHERFLFHFIKSVTFTMNIVTWLFTCISIDHLMDLWFKLNHSLFNQLQYSHCFESDSTIRACDLIKFTYTFLSFIIPAVTQDSLCFESLILISVYFFLNWSYCWVLSFRRFICHSKSKIEHVRDAVWWDTSKYTRNRLKQEITDIASCIWRRDIYTGSRLTDRKRERETSEISYVWN